MELFDVLDDKGIPTGETKLRSLVHRDGNWHKAIHVFIVNDKKQILFQKRSPEKDSNANKWDISCGGHASAGDTSLGTVEKELREELGIRIPAEELIYIDTFRQQSVRNEGTFINNEFNDVYLAELNLDITKLDFQKEEISELKWVDASELEEVITSRNPEFVQHLEEFRMIINLLHNK